MPGARWQKELALSYTDPETLLAALDLPTGLAEGSEAAQKELPMRVPRGFAARMKRGDLSDPLLVQVLSIPAESLSQPGFVEDPVGESGAAPVPGLLFKYPGRALMVLTGACAIHCRYCFRRHFPYEEHGSEKRRELALAHIEKTPEIREIILSGGDPLSLSDDVLTPLVGRLAMIPHLRRLRIHTRLPIVLPERVDDALLGWLTGTRLRPVVVLHVNHANEIDASVESSLKRLRRAEIPLLNQSVLLRGVNDTADAQSELAERLFQTGVLPYYLHLLDRVRGAAHFEVEESRASALLDELRARLPGYLVPRLVREIEGRRSKVPV